MISNGQVADNALFVIGQTVKDGLLLPFVSNPSNGNFQPFYDIRARSNMRRHLEHLSGVRSFATLRAYACCMDKTAVRMKARNSGYAS